MSMRFVVPTKTEYGKCPFCGHKDFCSMGVADDGQRYFFCRRPAELGGQPEPKQVVNTVFGQFVFKGVQDGGAFRFEEKAQYDARREAWKQSMRASGEFSINNSSENSHFRTYTEEEVAYRDRFYRTFLNKLTLEGYHFAKLKKEWGDNTKKWVEKYGIRSLPPVDKARFEAKKVFGDLQNPLRKTLKDKLGQHYPDEGIAGFYTDEKYGLQFYAESGIIYPLYNSKGQIVCLRIGVDFPNIESDEGEFKWNPYSGEWKVKREYSEEFEVCYSEKKGIFDITLNDKKLPNVANAKVSNKYKYMYTGSKEGGDTYGAHVGLFTPISDTFDYTICFGTEGEKKCIVGANKLNAPFVCIPGVSNFKRAFRPEDGYDTSLIDTLEAKGCKVFVVAYDADKAVNLNVLQAEHKFLVELVKRGITPAVAEWDAHWGKGLDDALMAGVTPMYYMVDVSAIV